MTTWLPSLLLPLLIGPPPGPATGTWTRKNAIGTAQTTVAEFSPRYGSAAYTIGNMGYVTGGNTNARLLKDHWS